MVATFRFLVFLYIHGCRGVRESIECSPLANGDRHLTDVLKSHHHLSFLRKGEPLVWTPHLVASFFFTLCRKDWASLVR